MTVTGIDAIQSAAPVTGTGGLKFADRNVDLPVDAIKPLSGPDFVEGGYIGEEGVTRTVDATDDKIKAWGGDAVKVIRSEHAITYQFEFLESANANVLKLIYGAEHVKIEGSSVSIEQTAKLPLRKAFILDMADGGAHIREVIHDGQLTVTGDVQFVHSDVIRYAVQIEAFPDNKGVKARSYIDYPESQEDDPVPGD